MIPAITNKVRPACLAPHAAAPTGETARTEAGWLWRG